MIETELKITLAPGGAALLARNPLLADLRAEPRRIRKLVTVYHDTSDHALAAARVALRLRRESRRWLQTVKRGRIAGQAGLFSSVELNRPAPGGRIDLGGPDPDGVYAGILELVGEQALAPVFETRVRRVAERLAAPGGGVVELAIDRGEIVAGELTAPIEEAELELIEGDVGAVYEIARLLFSKGPIRFAGVNKSTRGYRLARTGSADAAVGARRAGDTQHAPSASVETVALDVFRDCFGQIAANLPIVVETPDPEGPHQLRIGLRRLRSAFAVFGPILGADAMAPFSIFARDLGRHVGALRDLDVLIGEVARDAVPQGLDETAAEALAALLAVRREAIREEVRAIAAAPETCAFVFDLGRFIEARGWLLPGDHGQTERLATPISAFAPTVLDRQHKRALKRGRRIRSLDDEGLHELRKTLKTVRYAAEMLGASWPGKRRQVFLKALRGLQDTFGGLNDVAMAQALLTGPDAPGRTDPDAQRAIGWILGAAAFRAERERPELFEHWSEFKGTRVFWA